MKNNFQKIPLLLSVMLLVSSCFLFAFLYKEINDNNQKAGEGMAAWQKETSRRNEITSLDRTLTQITDNRTLLDSHFAESSDVVPFLNTLEKLAGRSVVKAEIDSVDIGANNSGLSVGLKARGSFESIYKFLTLLENSPYEINFRTMNIHRLMVLDASLKNNKNSEWEADFKIQLLSFIP